MFCNKCGNKLKDKEKFCGKCGNKISENIKNQKVQDKKHRSKLMLVVVVCIVVLVIISIGVLIFNRSKDIITSTQTQSEVITSTSNVDTIKKEDEGNKKIYGYSFIEELNPYTILSCESFELDYDNEISDMKKVKELILEKNVNEKEIQFEGISYLYFNEKLKIYVIKMKCDGKENQLYVSYKQEGNFEVEKLSDFYYADKTLVALNVDMDTKKSSEEFVEITDILFKRSVSVLGPFASQDGYLSFLNSLNDIFFETEYKVVYHDLKQGCILIRNVENEFLIDNEIYNPKSNEEKKKENEEYSKENINHIQVRLKSIDTHSETAFDNYSLSDFSKELSKVSNPRIYFKFELGNLDKDKAKYTYTVREIESGNSCVINYQNQNILLANTENITLSKGNHTFEITIKDEYNNQRVIKNTITVE